MIPIIYTIGFVLYCLSVVLSYSYKLKASSLFFPIGLTLALIVNYLWLYIAKISINKHDIYLRGLVWDSMIVGCYVLIPILFYGVKFNITTAIGIGLVVLGLILTKI